MKKYRIFLTVMALTMVAVLTLGACGKTEAPKEEAVEDVVEEAPVEEPAADDEFVIGVSCMDTTFQFFVPVNEAMAAVCEENGITINLQDAGNDAATQMNQVEAFINQGVDAIVVDTIDAGSLENLVAEAEEKGIPVIGRWTAIPGASCNMTLDEYGYGVAIAEVAAEWAKENYGEEEVEIAILGKFDYKPSVERIQGIKDTLAELLPNGKIVAEAQSNNLETALPACDAILQAHPNVRILLGDDDDSGLGICQSVMAFADEADYDKYYVGGADALAEAIRLIKEGTPYKGTVDLHTDKIGEATAQLLIDFFDGKELPESYLFNFDPLSYEKVMAEY